jgi:hypothetical protein
LSDDPSGPPADERDQEADDYVSKLFFNTWATAAVSDVKSKARVPFANGQQAFTIHAPTIEEGADALLASIHHLVHLPPENHLPTTMAGFVGRIPQDVANYFYTASFELSVPSFPLTAEAPFNRPIADKKATVMAPCVHATCSLLGVFLIVRLLTRSGNDKTDGLFQICHHQMRARTRWND